MMKRSRSKKKVKKRRKKKRKRKAKKRKAKRKLRKRKSARKRHPKKKKKMKKKKCKLHLLFWLIPRLLRKQSQPQKLAAVKTTMMTMVVSSTMEISKTR
jgi:hypothetical protein